MRGVLWGLGFLGGVGLALWALAQALSLRPLPQGCTPGPLPERAELWTSGAVEIPLCRKATLVLRLEGTLAQGHGPYALVVEGNRVLFEGEVSGIQEVRVRTSGKGPVALVFTNDLYQPPEDRNLFLRGLAVLPAR